MLKDPTPNIDGIDDRDELVRLERQYRDMSVALRNLADFCQERYVMLYHEKRGDMRRRDRYLDTIDMIWIHLPDWLRW